MLRRALDGRHLICICGEIFISCRKAPGKTLLDADSRLARVPFRFHLDRTRKRNTLFAAGRRLTPSLWQTGSMGTRVRIALAMGVVALLPLILVGWSWRIQVEHLRQARVAAEARATGKLLEQWRDAQLSLRTTLLDWRHVLEEDKDLARMFAGERLSKRRRARALARAKQSARRLGLEIVSLAQDGQGHLIGPPDDSAASFERAKSATGENETAWFWNEEVRAVGVLARSTWSEGPSRWHIAAERSWPASTIARQLGSRAQLNVEIFPVRAGAEFTASSEAGLCEIPLIGPDARPIAVLRADLRGLGYDDVEHVHRALATIALLAVLFVAAFSWFLASRLSYPLRRLTRSVQEVADGKREAVAMPSGPGAVGKLAAALDRTFHTLRRAEKERARVERLAAWTEVARRLTHEVRNPLTPAKLAVENMKRARNRDLHALDAVFEEESEAVLVEIGRLERLVREFADYARLPRAQMKPENLVEIVRGAVLGQLGRDAVGDHAECVRAPESERARPNVSADFHVEVDPAICRVDADLFSGAIANLVRNALEAFEEGGGCIQVTIRPSAAEGSPEPGTDHPIEIIIEDDGPGIADRFLDTLFDPYVTGRESGTGLGLSIVRRIIEEHGGTITAENKAEGGARFSIRLDRERIE